MRLESGARLGGYEIVAPLGAGGMGEVYRARDGKLGREVAIKVLPQELKDHPEKLARFEREARLLAALNHPGIATLYGVEEADGQPFLVMEVVEGETLAERIGQGPIALREALGLAQQVAEALEAAHDKGVIHRDLKPANIKVDPDGRVKVLDFGLAKALAGDEEPAADLSQSPTLSHDTTRAGIILGTAAYMSPEQAKGKALDRRSDVFSFGAVLYEMLTGRKAFAGEDVSDILAAILRSEPDWSALPASTPPALARLLRRCLAKDRRQRLRDMGDVGLEIEEILASPAEEAETRTAGAPRLVLTHLGALGLGLLVAFWLARPVETSRAPVRLSMSLDEAGLHLFRGTYEGISLSPDGKTVAFTAERSDEGRHVYLRPLDSPDPTALRGTQSAYSPFFSPDGRWMAYFQGALKTISVSGGAATLVAETSSFQGGTWGPDGTLVYSQTFRAGLLRVPATGGTPVELTQLGDAEVSHRFPWFLPNGAAVIFTVVAAGTAVDDSTIEAVLLETGERKVLVRGGTFARYTDSGHLVFARDGTLFAVPFDQELMEVIGEPELVLQGVAVNGTGSALFAIASGTLVYARGTDADARSRLVWLNRQGEEEPSAADAGAVLLNPELSPDGMHALVARRDADSATRDIWSIDLVRGAPTRLTFHEAQEIGGVWSPDGSRIVFNSNRSGEYQLYEKPSSGTGAARLLRASDSTTGPLDWSADGRLLVFLQEKRSAGGATARDLWVQPMDTDEAARPFLEDEFVKDQARLSPDGRWLAFISDESGRHEVYVADFPDAAVKLPVSAGGGLQPRWSHDGSELFYIAPGPTMMAVPVDGSGTRPEIGAATPLFETDLLGGSVWARGRRAQYDVAPDGRFLVLRDERTWASTRIEVILNWTDELKRLVPTP